MHVLITGAAGMIGARLTARIAELGTISGKPVTRLTLADLTPARAPDRAAGLSIKVGDLADPQTATDWMESAPDIIFHLAAVVSGVAEADTALGYAVNLTGTTSLLEAIREQHRPAPRFVFSSSIAVFGPPLPAVIPDNQPLTPQTSYGTQKAAGEMLIDDYSRKGTIDGISIRLPTIVVRPGKPNGAASSFYSSILREPMAGQEAVLPVRRDIRHWFASPDAAVGFLLHAAAVDTAPLGMRRALSMPGVTATVSEMIAALEEVAGPEAVALIREEPDATIAAIVGGWPQAFQAQQASDMGFAADASITEIVRAHQS